ncbi:MAG: hypothetical protein BWY63_00647 [Chloroflexi bacterium ADurb.Bin360]|nr:MAG: hypothetical protein BWY63_00647 [Chloroflexi bacterium ADurb.Bin360]
MGLELCQEDRAPWMGGAGSQRFAVRLGEEVCQPQVACGLRQCIDGTLCLIGAHLVTSQDYFRCGVTGALHSAVEFAEIALALQHCTNNHTHGIPVIGAGSEQILCTLPKLTRAQCLRGGLAQACHPLSVRCQHLGPSFQRACVIAKSTVESKDVFGFWGRAQADENIAIAEVHQWPDRQIVNPKALSQLITGMIECWCNPRDAQRADGFGDELHDSPTAHPDITRWHLPGHRCGGQRRDRSRLNDEATTFCPAPFDVLRYTIERLDFARQPRQLRDLGRV